MIDTYTQVEEKKEGKKGRKEESGKRFWEAKEVEQHFWEMAKLMASFGIAMLRSSVMFQWTRS